MGEITALLRSAREGDDTALAALFEALYPELRRAAHLRLVRDDGGTSLDTTALVGECYLKFARASDLRPEDRSHFMAYAATAMRSIVVDAARARVAERRGGGLSPVTLDSAVADSVADATDEAHVVALHDALNELAALDPRLAQVVEMRYFGGLSDDEVGEVLGLSARTVRRDWEKARLLLERALGA